MYCLTGIMQSSQLGYLTSSLNITDGKNSVMLEILGQFRRDYLV